MGQVEKAGKGTAILSVFKYIQQGKRYKLGHKFTGFGGLLPFQLLP